MMIISIEMEGFVEDGNLGYLWDYQDKHAWFEVDNDASIICPPECTSREIHITGTEYNIIPKVFKVVDFLKSIKFRYNSTCGLHMHISFDCSERTKTLISNLILLFTQYTNYESIDFDLFSNKKSVKNIKKGIFKDIKDLFNLSYRHTIVPRYNNEYCNPLKVGSHHSAIALSEIIMGVELRFFKMTLDKKILKSHITNVIKSCYKILQEDNADYDNSKIIEKAEKF